MTSSTRHVSSNGEQGARPVRVISQQVLTTLVDEFSHGAQG